MKRTHWIPAVLGMLGLFSAVAFAPPAAAQNRRAAPRSAAGSQGTETTVPEGMGIMTKQGMMAGKPMMGMPITMPYWPCCSCGMNWPAGMMWRGMIMEAGKDSENAAEMMQMHAEMMRANAEIMEKYAKQMQAGK